MNNKFQINDRVIVKSTGLIKRVVEVIETHRQFLNQSGAIVDIHKIQYRLEGYIATYYNEHELTFVNMTKEREAEIDRIIIDVNLAEKNFDSLKNMMNSEKPELNGFCICGGELWDIYFHNHNGVRCSKCNTVYKK